MPKFLAFMDVRQDGTLQIACPRKTLPRNMPLGKQKTLLWNRGAAWPVIIGYGLTGNWCRYFQPELWLKQGTYCRGFTVTSTVNYGGVMELKVPNHDGQYFEVILSMVHFCWHSTRCLRFNIRAFDVRGSFYLWHSFLDRTVLWLQYSSFNSKLRGLTTPTLPRMCYYFRAKTKKTPDFYCGQHKRFLGRRKFHLSKFLF